MGNICPCLRKHKPQKPPSYDMHETFQISENISDLGSSKPRGFEILNQQPSDQVSSDRKQTEKRKLNKQDQISQSVLIQSMSFDKQTTDLSLNQSQNLKSTIEKPQTIKKPQNQTNPNIKKTNRYNNKKVNLDDYRFNNFTSELKVKKLNTLNLQQFNINNCNDCELYIFDITANLYIDNSHNCFVYCAPCQSTVFIRDCTNIRMVGVSKQFRVRDCKDCEISLYCNSQPVIQSSSNIRFSNFGTIGYKQLYDQFIKTKMSVFNNHWSEIHDFTKREELNYELNLSRSIQCKWNKAMQDADLQPMEPMVPLTMDNPDAAFVLAILNNPSQQTEKQLAERFVTNKTILFKTFRGKVSPEVHNQLKGLFSQMTRNQYLCLKVSQQIASEVSNQFKMIQDEKIGKELQPLIFPSFKDEH